MGSRKHGLLPRILGGDLEPGVSQILVTLALAVAAQYAFWARAARGRRRGGAGAAHVLQPVRWSAQSALLADLVPEERRESAFGSVRIAFNTGAVGGPLLGAGPGRALLGGAAPGRGGASSRSRS